ncbi:hypothetical protein V7024_22455 [Bacillus sp. JJ864]|uniref:hypothetical protein n=1 Tax=Bacillus sp. JJ864 TaxID=3122975 RepID=UPI002FFEBF14
MKKVNMVSGLCIAGVLAIASMTGCAASETKGSTKQQESQKERDMKEADKAAIEYLRAYIDVDTKKLNDLQYKKFNFGEDGVINSGASKNLNNRFDLDRYDLNEGKNEYYYHVRYYNPVEERQRGMDLKMVKDENDGKWKNYEWAWGSNYSVDNIVGSMKPVRVHKWGQKE